LEGEKHSILRDICHENQDGRQKKIVDEVARELQYSSVKSLYLSKWSETNNLLLFQDKIYILQTFNLRYYIVFLHHDIKVADDGRY